MIWIDRIKRHRRTLLSNLHNCYTQSERGLNSSSILPLHSAQSISSTGITGRACLPTSIPKWCKLSLNLLIAIIYPILQIRFSHEALFDVSIQSQFQDFATVNPFISISIIFISVYYLLYQFLYLFSLYKQCFSNQRSFLYIVHNFYSALGYQVVLSQNKPLLLLLLLIFF